MDELAINVTKFRWS